MTNTDTLLENNMQHEASGFTPITDSPCGPGTASRTRAFGESRAVGALATTDRSSERLLVDLFRAHVGAPFR
jgi:hypothetical protein